MWSLFRFTACRPWKPAQGRPLRDWVLVEGTVEEALERFEKSQGKAPRLLGFTEVARGDAISGVLQAAFLVGHKVFESVSFSRREEAEELVRADSRVEIVEVKRIAPVVDGLFCGKCANFFPYVEANGEDGAYTCRRCREPTLVGTW